MADRNPSRWGATLKIREGYMKRQRGRGRKPGGGGGGGGNNNHNHGNRSLESNGPDVKIRGTAAQIYEKYAQYARDAQSGGDRVRYETYLQHAEHYYRVMAASMPRERLLQQQEAGLQAQSALEDGGSQQNDGNGSGNGDQSDSMRSNEQHGGHNTIGHSHTHNQNNSQSNNDADDSDDDNDADGDDRQEVEQPRRDVQARDSQAQEAQPQDAQGQEDGQEAGAGRGRRRRGRRRNNEGGPNAGGEAAGGGDTEARSALDSLARKQGALAGG
jgi:hypothetical protein